MVTFTATPAVWGELMVEKANPFAELGSTWIGAEVMPVLPLDATLSVREPTVLSVMLKMRDAPLSAPDCGVLAAGSLELTVTEAPVAIGFHQLSVEYTVTGKLCPAACAAGVPVRPAVVPGSAVCPGTMICTRLNASGWVTNGSLVPFFDGAFWIHA